MRKTNLQLNNIHNIKKSIVFSTIFVNKTIELYILNIKRVNPLKTVLINLENLTKGDIDKTTATNI